MRRTLSWTFALIALLGSADAARAQQIPSPFRYVETSHSIGFFAGYLLTDPGVVVDSVSGVEVDFGPRSAPVFGARYNLRFGGPLSGEVSLGFSPSERQLFAPASATDPTPIALEDRTEDVALLMGEAGVRFHLTGDRTWHGLAPFAAATGGVVADLNQRDEDAEEGIPETARFDFGPTLAVGAAIGTDWFPTRRLSVRAEVRDHVWKITTPQGFLTGNDDVSQWTHNVAFTLGAALHF